MLTAPRNVTHQREALTERPIRLPLIEAVGPSFLITLLNSDVCEYVKVGIISCKSIFCQ